MGKFCYNEKVVRDNIEEVLIQAPLSTFQEAKDWYPTAHRYAEGYAHTYKVPVAVTAGIIACLSPQKNWFHNLVLAEEFLACGGCDCRHVPVQVEKAQRIYKLSRSSADLTDILFILGGIKTRNFFMNIYMPENPDWATIDVHMIQLMTGNLYIRECTDKQYEFLKDVLIKHSNDYKMTPSEMQSVLWITWRKIKPKRVLS